MNRRALTQNELQQCIDNLDLDSESDPYATDEDSDYDPSDDSSHEDDNLVSNDEHAQVQENQPHGIKRKLSPDLVHEGEPQQSDIEDEAEPPNIIWTTVDNTFLPRKKIPDEKSPIILADLNRASSHLDVFFKLFPKSLFMFIADCTNERLDILRREKKNKQTTPNTDPYEIMTVVGCMMVMSYNRVPKVHMYWSQNTSLSNVTLKAAISRDRYLLLSSKLYFNKPEKPTNAGKTYYVDELLSCMKTSFQRTRTDSTFHSIDETMVKFKGRSAIKQYMPMKPVKRGIKLWQRCDSKTGYVYDMNVYAGKETVPKEIAGTLGERVVKKLCATIKDPDVVICFDRFFTSVELMNKLEFACVGTCMKNRKNVPKFEKLHQRGESQIVCNKFGSLAISWQDTKEVLLLSNCHEATIVNVSRTMKDGTKKNITCPEAISFYNNYMGGVDLADQFSALYDPNRKSAKWWKKVFQKLLMTAVANSWIVYQELQHNKTPFIDFVVVLAEQLTGYGKERAKFQRKAGSGRPSLRAKGMFNVGEHLPREGRTRRRCTSCTKRNIEKRTRTLCVACNVPLCKDYFLNYHK